MRITSKLSRILITIILLTLTTELYSLPINFGRTQNPLIYDEIKSKNFYIYHDHRTPHEGKIVLKTLENARPVLEKWLQTKRTRPLPVIMSSVTSNASFANFITDAIELQTLGEGGRDLAMHEFIHSTMYRHHDNWFGPAGAILHLPWMPAWWIEGLAESLSISIGSDVQAAIERHHALFNNWPSYDKLHNLYGPYGAGSFFMEGYATSGSIVSHILRSYNPEKLPTLLEDFTDYSYPWWWPLTLVPFNDFMPMDAAFENYTKRSGEQLYEEYKKAATKYWKTWRKNEGKSMPGFLSRKDGRVGYYPRYSPLKVKGNKLLDVINYGNSAKEVEITFNPNPTKKLRSYRHTGWNTISTIPDDVHYSRIISPRLDAFITSHIGNDRERKYNLLIRTNKNKEPVPIITRNGSIPRLFLTSHYIMWIEREKENSRICQVRIKSAIKKMRHKNSKLDVICPMKVHLPIALEYLGDKKVKSKNGAYITNEIWFRATEETLKGDRHNIIRYEIDSLKPRIKSVRKFDNGKPIAVGFASNDIWLLTASHNNRFLRKVTRQGKCIEERWTRDFPTRVLGLENGNIILSFETEKKTIYTKIPPKILKKNTCKKVYGHNSPLLYAMGSDDIPSLKEAIKKGSNWYKPTHKEIVKLNKEIDKAKTIYQEKTPSKTESKSQSAKWRPRPVFAFPWISADSGGNNFGLISVPLMDHMQNETVQLTMLYGPESRFPSMELTFTTTRFTPVNSFSIFRKQTYNGSFRGQTLYYDERGASLFQRNVFPNSPFKLDIGIISSTLIPFVGPPEFSVRGHQNEIQLNISHGTRLPFGYLSSYISNAVAPDGINKTWEHNKHGVGTSLSFPIGSTTFGLGLSGSMTRGKKRKWLKEVYRPLRTFVPGTGGGFNEITVDMLGPGELTSAAYGDTQARFKSSWVFPLVKDLETLVGIFYLERLDFTMFFNHGAIWTGDDYPTSDDFITAHGYNLDLQSDIKGVTVNLGIGTGQVLGNSFEVYFLFGFDALIDP